VPPTQRQIELTRSLSQIPDTQVLIAHQANGSPDVPPSKQIGTWEGPHAYTIIFCIVIKKSLDFISSLFDIILVAIVPHYT
jgi:hypothetical protein